MKGQTGHEMEVPILLHRVRPVYPLSTQSQGCSLLSVDKLLGILGTEEGWGRLGSSDRNSAFCRETIIAILKKLSFPMSEAKHLKSPVKEGGRQLSSSPGGWEAW